MIRFNQHQEYFWKDIFQKNFVEESLSSMRLLFGGLSLVSHLLIRRRELFVEKRESLATLNFFLPFKKPERENGN